MMLCSDSLDKIAPALVAAQADFDPVPKSGEHKFDRYKYATLGDYVSAISAVAAKHGLALVTSVNDLEHFPRKTSKGNDENGAAVAVSLTILHKSGQYITVEGRGEGQDRADKACYKSITGARKYVLASAFGLATTDDPEADPTVGGASKTSRSRKTAPASATSSKGTKSSTAAYNLPDRYDSFLPEQWDEYASQLPAEHVLPFATAILGKEELLSKSDTRHVVCNAIACRTRSVLRKGSSEREQVGHLLKKQQELLQSNAG